MSRHYSSSGLFNWLRKKFKIVKPAALSWEDWDKWEHHNRQQHPVAYWVTETLPEKLEDLVSWFVDPVLELKHYVRNRWVTETHKLKTDLAPGKYYELDTRILHGLFTELVNFVEIEKAWMQLICSENTDKYSRPWWHWGQWRCAEAGIDYLKWESSLTWDADWFTDPDHPDIGKPTAQAMAAKEILDLYTWWKEVYPTRPDAMELSGWIAFCDTQRDQYGTLFATAKTDEERNESRRCLDLMTRIEEQYQQEDEQNLIRLIKIRQHLWT
jgi:hypothetical protein